MALQLTKATSAVVTGLDTTSMGAVAASGVITSGSMNNTANNYPAMKIEAEINCDGASTETVYLYLMESTDGGTGFSTTATEDMRFIGAVTMNGTTLVRKVFDVGNLPDYWKIHAINNDSSNGLGSSSQISYQYVTFADV